MNLASDSPCSKTLPQCLLRRSKIRGWMLHTMPLKTFTTWQFVTLETNFGGESDHDVVTDIEKIIPYWQNGPTILAKGSDLMHRGIQYHA